MRPYFIWNNKNSLYMNIVVNELPPISKPSKRIDEYIIPGKSGKLYIDDDIYESFIYPISCTLLPNTDIREISSWLNGTGKLIISLEDDKFYEGIIKNQIDFKSISHVLYEFPIEIELQPFAYSINEIEHNIKNSESIFITKSNTEILPYLKLEGDGDITITINNKNLILKNIEDYIELDSKHEEAFKGNLNMNDRVYGDYLKLQVGENKISWIGNVTNLKIKYRETYI